MHRLLYIINRQNCNKAPHGFGGNKYSKNINKQKKLQVISVSKHLTQLWREYVQQKYQTLTELLTI